MLKHLNNVRIEKEIVQCNLDGSIIRVFKSVIEAVRFFGKSKSTASHITECCKGKRNKVLNYKWRYKNDESSTTIESTSNDGSK